MTVRPTAADALVLARRWFLAGRRVDMGALAAELGVNRVTLYRWVGSREALLAEVIWALAERALERERERATATGGERVVQVVTRFTGAALRNPGTARFLEDEGELAMRLLTRRDMGFQPRLIAAVQALLAEEVDAGRLSLPADLHDVADTIVRVVEAYVYLDRITGEEPDAARAASMLRLLLR